MSEKRLHEPKIIFSHWEEEQAQNSIDAITNSAITQIANKPHKIMEQSAWTKAGLSFLTDDQATNHIIAANLTMKNIKDPIVEFAGKSYLRRNDIRFGLLSAAVGGVDSLMQSLLIAEQVEFGLIDEQTIRAHNLMRIVNLYKDDPTGIVMMDAIIRNQAEVVEKHYDRESILSEKGKLKGYMAARQYYEPVYHFLTKK